MRDEALTYTTENGSREGVEVLTLVGPFTLGNIFEFQKLLRESKPPLLIFDLSQVPYMDSAGLGLLVNFYVSAQNNGRKMAIAGANYRLQALFDMTKVKELLRPFATVAEAEAAG